MKSQHHLGEIRRAWPTVTAHAAAAAPIAINDNGQLLVLCANEAVQRDLAANGSRIAAELNQRLSDRTLLTGLTATVADYATAQLGRLLADALLRIDELEHQVSQLRNDAA